MVRTLALAVFSMSALLAQSRAVVTVPVADMFSKPSLDADVVSQARYAVTVSIAEESNGWARIRTPGDDYPGWVPLASLRRLAPNESYPATPNAARVDSLRAHLYREPSVTKHAPLLTLPYEATLEVVAERPEENQRWLQVVLVDGRKAWIQRGDVSFDTAPLSVEALAALSHRFLGLPYTWGGTSSFGYDCSGFTQMLLRRGGVLMPRDAQPQADWDRMTKVERAGLKPGDLLYFGSSARKITHTGFYLGNGQFIHSTTNTHPVLQVSRLDDQPWTKTLVACRRWKP